MIKWKLDRLPEVDRPREKLRLKGAEALSDVELISVILGTGGQVHFRIQCGRPVPGEATAGIRALRLAGVP